MRRRTVAGRLAFVQTAVTLVALGVVVVGTTGAVDALLARKADEALNDTTRRVALLITDYRPDTLAQDWANAEIEELRPPRVRVEVHDMSGVVSASAGEGMALKGNKEGCFDEGVVRTCRGRAGMFLVLTGVDRSLDIQSRDRLIYTLIAVAAVAAALVTLTSRRIARSALRPLLELAARVSVIEPGAGRRVGLHCGLAELELLESRFDEFVDRVEDALVRERRLTAQASHELRTPLTVARAEIEALTAYGSSDAAAATRALTAIDRLAELVEALLWFARAQERLDDDGASLVNIADVVRAQLVELRRSREQLPIAFELPDEALVRGDERLLRRIIANLVDNALKYRDGGPVQISAAVDGDVLSIRVRNEGSLSKDVRERIFEPFFRGSRTQSEVPGFGLGLPFARAVARTHGGDVALGATDAEQTEFVLTLPAVGWSDDPNVAIPAEA